MKQEKTDRAVADKKEIKTRIAIFQDTMNIWTFRKNNPHYVTIYDKQNNSFYDRYQINWKDFLDKNNDTFFDYFYNKNLSLEEAASNLCDIPSSLPEIIKDYKPIIYDSDHITYREISVNFVLDKLQAAGIEVITDKAEFDRILESEKDLQKMIDNFEDFNKLAQQLDLLKEETKKEKNNFLNSQEEEIKYLEKEVSKLSDEMNKLKQFIPELREHRGITYHDMPTEAILVKKIKGRNYFLGKESNEIVYYHPDFQVFEYNLFFNFSEKEFGFSYTNKYFDKEYIERMRDKLNQTYIERMKSLLSDKDLLVTSIKKNLEKEIQSKSIEVNQLKERTIQQKTELTKETNSKDIASFKKLSNVLRTGEEEIVNNPTLGEVEIRFGGRNEGLAHIILRRIEERTHRTENRESLENATKNVTSILYLINKAVENCDAIQSPRGNWSAEINGIKAVIDKDKDGKYILTGFDNKQKKEESTEAIKAGIAQYGATPEFLEMYAQVGAVYSSYNQNIAEIAEKSSEFIKKDSITYGFIHNSKIYLNPEIMTSNVAVHEYTHLWDKYTQNTNPKLWEKGKEIFSKTYLWEDIKNDPNYADITSDNDLILSECHARICGEIAEKVLQNIAEQDGEIAKDAVIDWDKEVWNYIRQELDWNNDSINKLVEQTNGLLDETDITISLNNSIKLWITQPLRDLINSKDISIRNKENSNLIPLSIEDKEAITHIGADYLIKDGDDRYQIYITESKGVKTLEIDKNHVQLAGEEFEKVRDSLGLKKFDNIVNESDIALKASLPYRSLKSLEDAMSEGKKIIAVPFLENGIQSDLLITYSFNAAEASEIAKQYIKSWNISNTITGNPVYLTEKEIEQHIKMKKANVKDEHIKLLNEATKKQEYADKTELKDDVSNITLKQEKQTIPQKYFTLVRKLVHTTEDTTIKKILAAGQRALLKFNPEEKSIIRDYLTSVGGIDSESVGKLLSNIIDRKNIEPSKHCKNQKNRSERICR